MVSREENNPLLDRAGLKAAVAPNVGFFHKPLASAMEGALIALTGNSNQDAGQMTLAEKQRSLLTLQHTGTVLKELEPKKYQSTNLRNCPQNVIQK